MSVAKTLNAGATWTRYDIGQAKGITRSLAVDPTNSDIVFAGGVEDSLAALYVTGNGGTSWVLSANGITGDTVRALAFDPINNNIIYCGTSDGVFKSTDYGSNWSNAGCSEVNSILVNPNSSDTIYAGTDNGVFLSTDQAGTWMAMNNGLADTYVYCLGIHPGNYLFAATNMAGMSRWDLGVSVAENKITPVDRGYTGATVFTGPLQLPQDRQYRVYDISGREVDITKMGAGIYFIEINGQLVNKIVKIR